MTDKLSLNDLLDIANRAKLDVKLDEDFIVWKMDEDNEASLDLNEDGTMVNFIYISGAEVSSDNPDDLALVNAVNMAFLDNVDLPACTACIDIYSDDSEEEAIILRASLSLKGGVSNDAISAFFHDCSAAVDLLDDVVYGDGDIDDVDDDKE